MPTTLLCLHGWGGSKESFTELREALKDSDITILTPDLPGFGSEPEPSRPWTTDDYAEWVAEWLRSNRPPLPNPLPTGEGKTRLFLLGHSHGGRIVIKLAQSKSFSILNSLLNICFSAPQPASATRGISNASSVSHWQKQEKRCSRFPVSSPWNRWGRNSSTDLCAFMTMRKPLPSCGRHSSM